MRCLLVMIFSLCGAALADPLLWPLPGHQTLTGGFADSRVDHFHGGVDVRTGRENLPVVAPDDGWVERIAVHPGGYGRALYFRLSDGRTAVFGHLSLFAPPIESILREAQLACGTYRVDTLFSEAAPERTFFRRGDTLAFTGESGIGPPHLHFELREGSVQTDPLAAFSPVDSLPPVIVAVWWTSLKSYSPLGSGAKLTLRKTGAHEWSAGHVRSDSPVAFFVQTYDPNPWGRHSVPAVLRVKVHGRTVYETRPSRIDLLGPRDIYARIVWMIRRRDRLDVRRLFNPPPPPVHFDASRTDNGWLSGLNDAEVVIEVEDRAANISRVLVSVSTDAIPFVTGEKLATERTTGPFTLEIVSDPSAAWAVMEEVSPSEVRVSPDGLAFGDRRDLTYRFSSDEDARHAYFYQRTGKGASRPLSTCSLDTAMTCLSCSILRAGTYGIVFDTVPPNLHLSVRGGRITFRLTDSGCGVDDATVRCTIDGQTAIPEFEYEQRGGTIWTREPLAKGAHDVTFTAADRVGNEQTWRLSVVVP